MTFIYRTLSRLLLPRGFREMTAPELERAAAACVERERARLGAAGAAIAWARIFADLAIAGAELRYPAVARDGIWRQRTAPARRRGRFEEFMDNLRKDIRYALRTLARQPGFAFVTILTLALGIGANTAVFSVVRGVLLRPLGYPHPDRLELISSQFPNLNFDQFWMSAPEFVEFRQHNQAFAEVGGYSVGAANLGSSTPSRPVRATVTPQLMPVLGVPPLLGRWFSDADSAPNAPDVAILSFELWQRSFGSDPGVVGRTIPVNDLPTEIVGVMPRGFDVHDQKVELWLPLTIDPATFANNRGSHFLYLVGRLKDGVSRTQAQADVVRLVQQWQDIAGAGKHAPNPQRHQIRIDQLREDVVGGVRRPLVLLQSAVGFVLLIACANLANLLIARADSRSREYAVRAALGASRWRLFVQLLTEGFILASTASVLGIGLASAGVASLLRVNPGAIPRTSEIGIDYAVLGFTLAVAGVTGLVFALVPLMHLRGNSVGQVVKEGGARTTGGGRVWLRSSLVVAEIALAVTLVVGAGLMIRSFSNLLRVDMGFDPSRLASFGLVLPGATYPTEKRLVFYDRLLERLRALPGVESVSAMSGLPPLRDVNANDTDFEHIPNNRPPGALPAENVDFYQNVTVGYTETMGISVVSGRAFKEEDRTGAPVALINQAAVKKFYGDRNPIGSRLHPFFSDSAYYTVVGVLKDVKQGGVAASAGTELYLLTDQLAKYEKFLPGQMNFVIRSRLAYDAAAPSYRQAVTDIDPSLPIVRMRSMDDVIDAAVARPRFLTVLLGVFAGLALLLAAVGTYGVFSYLVTERRREIGVRMALGADRSNILQLILRRGLLLSGIGLCVGLAASLALGRLLSTLLFDVTARDPGTLAWVSAVIALVATIACIIPAWRATRVDPLVVLRDS